MDSDYKELYQELHTAIKEVDDIHNLADATYAVRDNIDWDEDPFEGSSWDHPKVLRYSAAVGVIHGHLDNFGALEDGDA